MSLDELSERRGHASQRIFVPLGLAVAALLFILGTVYVFRIPIAESVAAGAMRDAGLSDVSLSVTRADIDGLVIEDVVAENGALHVGRIDLAFSIPDLLRSRLKALTIDGLNASFTWGDDGPRLGAFRLHSDGEPLDLPHIETLQANDMMVAVTTPAATYRAPLSISAQPVERGWDTIAHGNVEGPGANIALEWKGVISPEDLSQSSGQGLFDLVIDDFIVPDTGARLTARGRVTLDAGRGMFAMRVVQPLTFSAVPAQARARPSLIQSLESLPWSLTIAPSQSEAVLVLTAAGERRSLRIDVAARGEAGDGRIGLAFVGEAARSPQETAFRLDKGHVEVQRLPFAGGIVSGHFTLSDFAGTTASASGKVNAAADVSGVSVGEASIGHAVATTSSAITIRDTGARIDLEAMSLTLSRGVYGDWSIAAPAELALAKSPSGRNSVEIGRLGLRNTAEISLALPELVLSNQSDENARIVVRTPELRIGASTSGLSVDTTLAARGISLAYPSFEFRDGRFDGKISGGEPSGTASARFIRIGTTDGGFASAGALLTTATLNTKGDDLNVRGSFSTVAGSRLGDFTVQTSPDFKRGNASVSIQEVRIERGGKVDPSEIGFLSPVTDLSGTVSLEARSSWSGARSTESATAKLEDVSFALGDVSVVGLTTAIELTGMSPPQSAEPRNFAVRSIAAGLPLSDLSAVYTVPGDGTVVIKEGSANVAGGQITLAEAVIPFDSAGGALSLGVRKIDMGILASQAKINGLSVTGTLTGAVPLRNTEAGYEFVEGILRSDGPGKLVYKPSSPSPALAQNQGGSLLLQALSNFSYDRLSITLNGPVTEEISLLVAIAGENPDLYGGYPIEFNLNLSGRLTQILRQGLVGAGIPGDIERQLREGKPPG